MHVKVNKENAIILLLESHRGNIQAVVFEPGWNPQRKVTPQQRRLG